MNNKIVDLPTSHYLNGTYTMHPDTIDGNWHRFDGIIQTDTSCVVQILFGFQENYGGYYGDSGWIDNVNIHSLKGLIIPYSVQGGITGYATVYPYIIDHLSAVNHRASAMTKDQSRIRSGATYYDYDGRSEWTANVGYEGFLNFHRGWAKTFFDVYDTLYNAIMLDQVNSILGNAQVWGDYQDCIEYPDAPVDLNWKANEYAFLEAIYDTCSTYNKKVVINCIGVMESTFMANSDYTMLEGVCNGHYLRANSWAQWRNYADNYNDGFNAGDSLWRRTHNLGTGVIWFNTFYSYPYGTTDTNRWEINSMATFLLKADTNDYYCNSYADIFDNIQTFDFGVPIDTACLDTSGVDNNGDSFIVIAREWVATNGDTFHIYYKPMNWDETGTDSTFIPHSSRSLYLPLDWTGRAGTPSDSVSLRFNEGAILIRIGCD
jgi:hypothetical protein